MLRMRIGEPQGHRLSPGGGDQRFPLSNCSLTVPLQSVGADTPSAGVSSPSGGIVSMKPRRFYLGVFFVTASTLMLQVIQTCVLSVMLWYYMAFLVISLAMFGITAGTVWVYLRRQRFSERTLSHDLTYFTSVLAIVT